GARGGLFARLFVLRSPGRVLQSQAQEREREPRQSRDVEGRAPSEPLVDQPSERVSGRGPDWNRREEHGEDPSASLLRKRVRQKRRGDRAVSGLSDPDRRSSGEESREGPRQAAERRGRAPET